jgi:hypothetical protein
MPRLCVGSEKDLLDGDASGALGVLKRTSRCFEFGRSRDQKQSQSNEDSSDNSRDARTSRREASRLIAAVRRANARKSITPLASNAAVRLAQQ